MIGQEELRRVQLCPRVIKEGKVWQMSFKQGEIWPRRVDLRPRGVKEGTAWQESFMQRNCTTVVIYLGNECLYTNDI